MRTDSRGYRIIDNQDEREWLYQQIIDMPDEEMSIGQVKERLKVNCASIDIMIGWEHKNADRRKRKEKKGGDTSE